jgi:hypothetical protein
MLPTVKKNNVTIDKISCFMVIGFKKYCLQRTELYAVADCGRFDVNPWRSLSAFLPAKAGAKSHAKLSKPAIGHMRCGSFFISRNMFSRQIQIDL